MVAYAASPPASGGAVTSATDALLRTAFYLKWWRDGRITRADMPAPPDVEALERQKLLA
jgi:hypothetical protein